jgi:hypothetical protein
MNALRHVALFAIVLVPACHRSDAERSERSAGVASPSSLQEVSSRLVAPSSPRAPFAPTAASIRGASVVYYDVHGGTAAALRAELNALGPTDESGVRHDANTHWELHWNWPGTPDGSCGVARAVVTHSVVVTFPRWLPAGSVDAELVSHWQRYVQALSAHEQGHVDLTLALLPKLEVAIKNASCSTANDVGDALLSDARAEQKRYDDRTGHGRTQGAVFP